LYKFIRVTTLRDGKYKVAFYKFRPILDNFQEVSIKSSN